MAEALIHLVGDLSWVALFAYIVHCVHDYSVRRYQTQGPMYRPINQHLGPTEPLPGGIRLFDGYGVIGDEQLLKQYAQKKDQH